MLGWKWAKRMVDETLFVEHFQRTCRVVLGLAGASGLVAVVILCVVLDLPWWAGAGVFVGAMLLGRNVCAQIRRDSWRHWESLNWEQRELYIRNLLDEQKPARKYPLTPRS